MQPGVYMISCTNGRFYIGSSRHVPSRFIYHRRDLRAGRHASPHMQRAWDKHGESAFSFEILEATLTAEAALEREQFYIDLLHPFGMHGFNAVPQAARTTLGYRYSSEQKAALSYPVAQYSRDGALLAVWPTLTAAANAVGLRWTASISRSVLCGWKMAAGFFWRDARNPLVPQISVQRPKQPYTAAHRAAAVRRARPVEMRSLNGEMLRRWETSSAAAAFLGKSYRLICRACRAGAVAYGYSWRYAETVS